MRAHACVDSTGVGRKHNAGRPGVLCASKQLVRLIPGDVDPSRPYGVAPDRLLTILLRLAARNDSGEPLTSSTQYSLRSITPRKSMIESSLITSSPLSSLTFTPVILHSFFSLCRATHPLD